MQSAVVKKTSRMGSQVEVLLVSLISLVSQVEVLLVEILQVEILQVFSMVLQPQGVVRRCAASSSTCARTLPALECDGHPHASELPAHLCDVPAHLCDVSP